MKIYRANIIYTPQQGEFKVVPRGYVLVEDNGTIETVMPELPEEMKSLPVTDYGDRLLIPAMYDLHVHAPQYRNQGLAMDLELLPWLQNYTFPEEQKYADTGYAELMYRRFVNSLCRQGTMRVAAFASVHLESTRVLMRLMNEAGMAGFIGKVNMDRNCPEPLTETTADARRATRLLMEEFGSRDSQVRPIITPRFIPSCSHQLLETCSQMASKYQLPVQSHLSENHSEIELVKQLEPESRGYADAYDRYGLLGQTPTVMAHCVWTTDEEIELLSRRGVMIAHCPTSNMNLASGMAPIRRYLDAGIAVALGSDISGGHSLNIFRMITYAIQTSKMHYERTGSLKPLSLAEAFWIATKSAGRFFGLAGSFEHGYQFDALVIDDSELAIDPTYTLLERLERFVNLGDDRHICTRYCGGREIKEI